LLAAGPADAVDRPEGTERGAPGGFEDAISHGMAERIIDRLEAVDVEHHEGQRRAAGGLHGEEVLGRVQEGPPGPGTGERSDAGGRGVGEFDALLADGHGEDGSADDEGERLEGDEAEPGISRRGSPGGDALEEGGQGADREERGVQEEKDAERPTG